MKKFAIVLICFCFTPYIFGAVIYPNATQDAAIGLKLGSQIKIKIATINSTEIDKRTVELNIEENISPAITFIVDEVIYDINNTFIIASIDIPPNPGIVGNYKLIIKNNGTKIDEASINIGGEIPSIDDLESQTFTGQQNALLSVKCNNADRVKFEDFIGASSPSGYVRPNPSDPIQYDGTTIRFSIIILEISTPKEEGISISARYLEAGTNTQFNKIINNVCRHTINNVSFVPAETIRISPEEIFTSSNNNERSVSLRIKIIGSFPTGPSGERDFYVISTPNIFQDNGITTKIINNNDWQQVAGGISLKLLNNIPEQIVRIRLLSISGNINYYGKLNIFVDFNAKIIKSTNSLDPYNQNNFKVRHKYCTIALIPKINDDLFSKLYKIETGNSDNPNEELTINISPNSQNTFNDLANYKIFERKFKIDLSDGKKIVASTDTELHFEEGQNTNISIPKLIDLKDGIQSIENRSTRYSESDLTISFKPNSLEYMDGRQTVAVDLGIEDKKGNNKTKIQYIVRIYPKINKLEYKTDKDPIFHSKDEGDLVFNITKDEISKYVAKDFDKKNALLTINSIQISDSVSDKAYWNDIRFRIKAPDEYPIFALPPSIVIFAPNPQETLVENGIPVLNNAEPVKTSNIKSWQMSPINIGFGWHWNIRKNDGEKAPYSFTLFGGVFNIGGSKNSAPADLLPEMNDQNKNVDFIQSLDVSAVGFIEAEIPMFGKKLPFQGGLGVRIFNISPADKLNYERPLKLFFIVNLDFIKFIGSLFNISEIK